MYCFLLVSHSMNMWPYLLNGTGASPRTEIMLSSKYADKAQQAGADSWGSAALIQGPYKLVRHHQQYCFYMGPKYPNESTTHKNEDMCTCGKTGCLFNIFTDPGEHEDLSSQLPAIHATMLARARALDETSIDFIKGGTWPLNYT